MTTDPEPMVASDAVAAVLADWLDRDDVSENRAADEVRERATEVGTLIASLIEQARADGWDEACKGFAWALDNGPAADAAAYVAANNPHREGRS